MKIVETIFEKTKIFIFFSCELPLILRIDIKRKQRVGDICKGTLDIEYERDWSVGLGATLGDGQKIKNYFFSLRFFREKPIVGLRMCYKLIKFNQNR